MSDDAADFNPLSDAEFNRCLMACGPFEPAPVLAVGVSGGPDSMALCLLADRWARARGGRVIALTVDHGLRPESAAEAVKVGGWLQKYGIEHHILAWTGLKPAHAIQQKARAARYRLLGHFCADRGILHLLVAHHLEDQAETYALRLSRGSGVEGLAGMPATGRLPEHMADAPLLLRPLLSVPKARLLRLLETERQPWITDPSNDLDKYQRVRIRKLFAEAAPDSLTVAGAIAAVKLMQGQKVDGEVEVVRFLSRFVSVDPAGFASFDRQAYCDLPDDIAQRCLGRLTMVIGGRVYPPRSERLATVNAAIRNAAPGGWTLSGCLFEAAEATISLYREAANCSAETLIDPAADMFWDGRFRVGLRGIAGYSGPVLVRKLGYAGWCDLLGANPNLRDIRIPFRAKLSLPAFFHGDKLIAVPLLSHKAAGEWETGDFYSDFDPAMSLSG